MSLNQAQAIYSLLFLKGFFTSVKVQLKAAKDSALAFLAAVALAERRLLESSWQSLTGTFPKLKMINSVSEGVGLIVEIIFISIGLYVAAFILPGALTAIATTALTSVNGGVQTLFQVLVPIMAVVVLILLLVAVVRRAMA